MTTNVLAGNVPEWFSQRQTASLSIPVRAATSSMPPRTSNTSWVEFSSMPQGLSENYSDCKPRNLFACTEIVSGHCAAAMPDWKRLTIQERLRALRRMHGLGQEAFANEIGASGETDAYGKAERTGNIAQMAPAIYRRFPEIDAGWLF